jgi:hypothetical protein
MLASERLKGQSESRDIRSDPVVLDKKWKKWGTKSNPVAGASRRTGRSVTPALAIILRSRRPVCPSSGQVTASDLLSGQIRIPSANVSLTRTLFPCSKAAVAVALKGRLLQGSWNPRTGLDRKRSGVLRVGSVLHDLVGEDEVLTASVRDGAICID